jgi:hypothetical protein
MEFQIPEGFKSSIYATEGVKVKQGAMFLPSNSTLILKK